MEAYDAKRRQEPTANDGALPPAPEKPALLDFRSELERLADLPDEEFAAAKKKLLG